MAKRDPNRTYQRAPGAGRPRIPLTQVIDAIEYRQQTGCSWAELPSCFGAPATIHRRYRELVDAGQIDPVENWRNTYADPLAELAAVVTPEEIAAAQAQPFERYNPPVLPILKNRHTP